MCPVLFRNFLEVCFGQHTTDFIDRIWKEIGLSGLVSLSVKNQADENPVFEKS